jgi:uncharacterized protein YceK
MASNRKWTVVCSGMLLLITILVNGCSSANNQSKKSQSADPFGADYQAKMDEAIKQSQACQAKGGSPKECAAPIDAVMKSATDNFEAEAAAKFKAQKQ